MSERSASRSNQREQPSLFAGSDDDSLFGAEVMLAAGPTDEDLHEAVSPPVDEFAVVMYCDGGSRGNPGPAAVGAVVFDAVTNAVLAEVSECIGIATNNVAEYSAMLAGLDAATALGADAITVRADSKLLIEQVKGNYKVKHPGLKPLHTSALHKLTAFRFVTLEHVRREYNREADALVNRALDAQQRERKANS